MPTTEGAAICTVCGETATHYHRCAKAIINNNLHSALEDLSSARWALRSAVNLIPRQLNKDIAVERFIMNQDALCELTPMPEITPSCDTCRFARGYSCCAHPVTIPFPSRRWCGEHQEKESR